MEERNRTSCETPVTPANSKNGVNRNFVFITIAIAQFAVFLALSIMAPFFSLEASKKGVSTTVSGLVFSVYALVIFLASPMMGFIIGRVGPRNMLMIGVLVAGVSNIIFGLLDYVENKHMFIIGFIVVRIFEGIGAAGFSTASFVFVADLFQDKIGTIFGLMEIVIGFGCLTGPAIGGILFDWGGYQLPFHFVGVSLLLTLPISFVILPKLSKSENVDKDEKNSWVLLKIRPVMLVTIVTVIASITTGYRLPVLELHLRNFNLSAKEIGLFFFLMPCSCSIFSIICGYLTDRTKRLWILMVLGLLSMAVSLVLSGPSKLTGLESTLWTNAISQVLLGITSALALIPTFKGMLVYATEGGYPEGISTYGMVGGLWNSAYSFGDVIGPMAGSYLTEHHGFPFCSDLMAGMCILTALAVSIAFLLLPSPKCNLNSEGETSSNGSI